MKTTPKKRGKFLILLKEFFSWLAYQDIRAQVVVFLTIFLVLFLLGKITIEFVLNCYELILLRFE